MNEPEPRLADLTWPELAARIARAQLYAIEMELAGSAVSTEAVRDHLAYYHKLESEGRLFGWGPLEGGDRELAIVAAASRDDAENIAAHDPLVLAGAARTRARAHTMNEGVACYIGRAISLRAIGAGRPFDPDLSGVKLNLTELDQRKASVLVNVVFLKPTDRVRPAEDFQTIQDHFVWLRDNEMSARLLDCGPLEPLAPLAQGIWGGGLGVLAVSRREAEAIAAVEPSGVAGYRSLDIVGWRLEYGLAAPVAASLVALAQLH